MNFINVLILATLTFFGFKTFKQNLGGQETIANDQVNPPRSDNMQADRNIGYNGPYIKRRT